MLDLCKLEDRFMAEDQPVGTSRPTVASSAEAAGGADPLKWPMSRRLPSYEEVSSFARPSATRFS